MAGDEVECAFEAYGFRSAGEGHRDSPCLSFEEVKEEEEDRVTRDDFTDPGCGALQKESGVTAEIKHKAMS